MSFKHGVHVEYIGLSIHLLGTKGTLGCVYASMVEYYPNIGGIYPISYSDVRLTTPPSNFNVGDIVIFKSNYGSFLDGKSGKITKVNPTYYEVEIEGTNYSIVDETELTLQPKSNTNQNTIYSSPVTFTVPKIDMNNYKITIDRNWGVDPNVHLCTMKEYFGMNERYSYCTICDKKEYNA